jgi:hypothetical protein
VYDAQLAAGVERKAAHAGVPGPLWATVAVEARRCASATGGLLEVPTVSIAGWLDETATVQCVAGDPSAMPSRPGDYAWALLQRAPRRARTRIGPLLLRASETMLTAWMLASAQTGLAPEQWAAEQLRDPPRGGLPHPRQPTLRLRSRAASFRVA